MVHATYAPDPVRSDMATAASNEQLRVVFGGPVSINPIRANLWDLYGTPPGLYERRIGAVVEDHDGKTYRGWRNGHACQPTTFQGAINWVVSEAAHAGEGIYP
jgi:hypothetical protein